MQQRNKAFTLIELLIVVAIIAILAAIAVPNFLEAQTRSKVSRTRADMRTVITGLESYRVDGTTYPPAADFGLPNVGDTNGSSFHARTPSYLTTPIAYISSIPLDPFVNNTNVTFVNSTYPAESRVGYRYAYFAWDYYLTPAAGGNNPQGYADLWCRPKAWTGEWLIYGYGPNQTPFQGARATFMPYDPTNGTISDGNVVRTQRNNDGIDPHPVSNDFLWPAPGACPPA